MKPRPIWQQRPLFCLAILFSTGIWAGVRFDLGLLIPAGLMVSAVSFLLSLLSRRRAIFSLGLAILFLGAFMGNAANNPQLPSEGKYSVNAVASGTFELLDDGRAKGALHDVVLVGDNGIVQHAGSAYWTYTSENQTVPLDGQRVRFTASIYHPEGQVNPFGFDFRMYLLRKGMTIGISGAKELTLTPTDQAEPDGIVIKVRKAIAARFDDLFIDTADLPKALLIGERSDFSEDIETAFQRAGVAHILAISGQHVVMLMGLVLLVIKPFHPSSKVIFGIVLVLLLLYCILLDFQPSVVRAAIAMIILLISHIHRRRSDALTSLLVAFLILLAVNPLELFSVGFQLSFSSVAGIVMIGDRLKQFLAPFYNRLQKGVGKRALDALVLSISATTGVALPLACTFYQISWIGILLSPVACLIAGLLMAGYILTSLISIACMPLAHLLAAPIVWLGRLFLEGTAYFGKLPYTVINVPSPAPALILALTLCYILITRYSCIRVPFKAAAGCAALLLAVVTTQAMVNNEVKYTQLSMGDADSAVIEDGDTTFVIDTGEYGGDLASYLLGSGRHVNYLLLTHLHTDHAMGLLQLQKRGVKIDQILLPDGYNKLAIADTINILLDQARFSGIPVRTFAAGDCISSNRVTVQALWPIHDTIRRGQDANDFSMMLLCNLDGAILLSAGDIGVNYECYAARPAHMLKIAHHGSRFATSENFLDIVSPSIALVSADDSRSSVISELDTKLKVRHATLFSTFQSGALSLFVGNGQVTVQSYLNEWSNHGL